MILRFVPGCTREYEPELPTAVVALEDPIHEAHSEAGSEKKISFERGTFVNLGGLTEIIDPLVRRPAVRRGVSREAVDWRGVAVAGWFSSDPIPGCTCGLILVSDGGVDRERHICTEGCERGGGGDVAGIVNRTVPGRDIANDLRLVRHPYSSFNDVSGEDATGPVGSDALDGGDHALGEVDGRVADRKSVV